MIYDSLTKDNDPSESLNDTATNQANDKSYLSNLLEQMMIEMGITAYDNRTCHMLVDLLQRESLFLLKSSAENSEKRLSSEKEKLLLGNTSTTVLTKPNMMVSEEDAQIACQEYINNKIVQPGVLRDLLDIHKYSNNVRLASKHSLGSKQKAFTPFKSDDDMGQYPSGPAPQLPENLSLNTLLPHWDIDVRENKY